VNRGRRRALVLGSNFGFMNRGRRGKVRSPSSSSSPSRRKEGLLEKEKTEIAPPAGPGGKEEKEGGATLLHSTPLTARDKRGKTSICKGNMCPHLFRTVKQPSLAHRKGKRKPRRKEKDKPAIAMPVAQGKGKERKLVIASRENN